LRPPVAAIAIYISTPSKIRHWIGTIQGFGNPEPTKMVGIEKGAAKG
jgi:hypothetical protein